MSSNNPPGVIYPTKQGMLAGNPQDSAFQQSQNTSNKAASLNKAIGGRRRRSISHKRSGRRSCKRTCKRTCKRSCKRSGKRRSNPRTRGGTVAPQYDNMLYTPANGPESHPNNQIVDNTKTSTQGAANAVYDKDAFSGGRRTRRRMRRRKSSRRPTKRRHSSILTPMIDTVPEILAI